MKMYHITVRKLNDGGVDIKNDLVRKVITEDALLKVHYNGENMTMDKDQLIFTNRFSSCEIINKLTKKPYKLYNYKWNSI